MQLKWCRIPVGGCSEIEEELNAFLGGHRVLSVARELVERDSAPGWAVCVEYQENSGAGDPRRGGSGRAAKKIDYREVLSEADFAVFSKLRELRKSLAESEGVPVYAIFCYEQLQRLEPQQQQPGQPEQQQRVPSCSQLRNRPGWGAEFPNRPPFRSHLPREARDKTTNPPPPGASRPAGGGLESPGRGLILSSMKRLLPFPGPLALSLGFSLLFLGPVPAELKPLDQQHAAGIERFQIRPLVPPLNPEPPEHPDFPLYDGRFLVSRIQLPPR